MHQLSPPPRLDKMCICQMCSSHYSSHNSRSLQLILLPPLQLSERMLSRQKMWLSAVIYWHMTPVVTATVVNSIFTQLGKYRLCSIKNGWKEIAVMDLWKKMDGLIPLWHYTHMHRKLYNYAIWVRISFYCCCLLVSIRWNNKVEGHANLWQGLVWIGLHTKFSDA